MEGALHEECLPHLYELLHSTLCSCWRWGNFIVSRVNEVLGREKTRRSGEKVLRPAFTAVMQFLGSRDGRDKGRERSFLMEDSLLKILPLPRAAAMLFGWKGWWV